MRSATLRPWRFGGAWLLAWAWMLLIVYASLFPFGPWADRGLDWWLLAAAPLPHYWTWFDAIGNVLGYVPLGLLLALALARGVQCAPRAWLLAAFGCSLLSASMEALQTMLPMRVPSNLDWMLNTAGAVLGVALAALAQHLRGAQPWEQLRRSHLAQDAWMALSLLALWPLALLAPQPVPFGLGQVYERLENALAQFLQGTPFLQWLPVRDIEPQAMLHSTEALAVALGLIAPALLGAQALRGARARLLCMGAVLLGGVCAITLATALAYGPPLALAWLWQPVWQGLALGCVALMLCAWLPRGLLCALALAALCVQLVLLNESAAPAYFDSLLSQWEQGRFIRFYGATQWLGWLWPYAAVLHLLHQLRPAGPALQSAP